MSLSKIIIFVDALTVLLVIADIYFRKLDETRFKPTIYSLICSLVAFLYFSLPETSIRTFALIVFTLIAGLCILVTATSILHVVKRYIRYCKIHSIR